VALGEAPVPEDQLLQALEEIVAAARLLQAPEREGGELVGARRASEAEVDPAREQRLERLEALGDDERRVVRSITPPEPTRMRFVAAAICPIMISGAGLATEGRLWCSASQ